VVSGVIRSRRDSPEPSRIASPLVLMPFDSSHERTTAVPASSSPRSRFLRGSGSGAEEPRSLPRVRRISSA
jgi:hypothetical protein